MLPLAGVGPASRPRGVLRAQAADFVVEELLPFEPDGEGEHLLLQIEETGANTHWVAGQLARAAGIPRRDVGYAGRKDRHAVTTQWFSLRIPGGAEPDASAWMPEGCRLLRQQRHRRKLRPGYASGNRFRLRVTALEGDLDLLVEQLAGLAQRGAPNYFTEQRFGRDGDPLTPPAGPPPRGRDARGMFLSATRSALFNRVLAERVRDGSWERARAGEVLVLDGRGSVFGWPDEEAERGEVHRRIAAGELHPTAPMPGRGGMRPADEVATLEDAVLASSGDALAMLEAAGVDAARRATRVIPRELEQALSRDGGSASVLELGFRLPAGSYATAVLRELVDYRDGSRSST